MSRIDERFYSWLKRGIDIFVSALGLLLLSPLLLVFGVLIRRKLGSPVFFVQERPGLQEAFFRMIKFRTMREAYDSAGNALPDSERLTEFGKFLRSKSIDELPELWNVFVGDMSLVGPRPLLIRYLPHFSPEERLRFTVKPGITGWAQINGRNESAWNRRLENDVWYVKNRTTLLDIKILISSIRVVLQGSGLQVDPSSSMQNFDDERSVVKCKNET